MVRANYKFDIQGLRVWLEAQGHLTSDLPANWDPVWSDPERVNQPEDRAMHHGAVAHLALPGHGWIVEGAAPSSVKCRLCGVATAIWLCSMAVAEAKKDLGYVTVFATELGKIVSLVDQARRRYAKAAGRYREEHVLGIRGFLERAKATAASATSAAGAKAAVASATSAEGEKAPATSANVVESEKAAAASATSAEGEKAAAVSVTSAAGEKAAATAANVVESEKAAAASANSVGGEKAAATTANSVQGEKAAATAANSVQGDEAARYFEERLRDVEKGATVGLMDNLGLDSMFKALGTVLRGLQNDVLVDTRNPGYAQPGAVAKGHPVTLRTRVERCLLAAGFTNEEIGEKLIRSLDDPLDRHTYRSADEGRSRAEEVRDRVSPRRHRSKR